MVAHWIKIHVYGQTIIKSTDSQTRASISEVEPITRKGKVYYKIGLFVGFNEVDLIEKISNEVTDLIEKNIFITSYPPRYYYTELAWPILQSPRLERLNFDEP